MKRHRINDIMKYIKIYLIQCAKQTDSTRGWGQFNRPQQHAILILIVIHLATPQRNSRRNNL